MSTPFARLAFCGALALASTAAAQAAKRDLSPTAAARTVGQDRQLAPTAATETARDGEERVLAADV
ncbi:MAG TPA: hypothetical protein VFX59_03915, partial [Polyangiales bacterium]|nr:hypothetical protein [Polyangiales bacterium]